MEYSPLPGAPDPQYANQTGCTEPRCNTKKGSIVFVGKVEVPRRTFSELVYIS